MKFYGSKFFKRQEPLSLASARVIVPLVLDFLHPRSVIDVGCGVGTWLSVFREYGIQNIVGMDGDYVLRDMLRIPEDRFMSCDLTRTFNADLKGDLVLCLEVAEHLPETCAEPFVSFLTKLAPAILFSAAVPGQAKTRGEHLNEQWQDYWAAKFKRQGLLPVDLIRPKVWADADVAWWYAQNVLLYVTPEYLNSKGELISARNSTQEAYLNLVHPTLFKLWSDLGSIPLRRLVWIQKKVSLAILQKVWNILTVTCRGKYGK